MPICLFRTGKRIDSRTSLEQYLHCVKASGAMARSPFPRRAPLAHLFTFKPRLTRAHCAHTAKRGTLCYFDLFLRWKDGPLTRSAFFRGAFMSAAGGCPPPALLQPGDLGAARGPPGPQGQSVPLPSHPERTSSQGQMWQLAQPPWRSRSEETMSNLPPTIIF